ncbi:PAS domain S-box protein [Croceitalea dokdonensis]|uniref:PAS domain S-box protein n=1 Tax=Croceitalea dokdonensis TaxID=346188 RepID=UPI000AD2F375|nr:PAS domain S-box protein [Croceitalea dokdonensis]
MKTKLTTPTGFLIKQLPNKVVCINHAYTIIHISEKLASFLGYDHRVGLGMSLLDMFGIPPNSIDANINKVFNGLGREFTIATFNKTVNVNATPWYDQEEVIIGAILEIEELDTNTTGVKTIERLERLLRHQSEISKVGTWIYDIQAGTVSWSAMTKTIHDVEPDYEPDIETALNFYEKGHYQNTIAMLVHKCISNGNPWNVTSKIISSKGVPKWVTSAGRAIKENGEIVKLVGTFQDISEQVEAENKIKESEALLRTLIDNLPLNIYIKDKEFKKILLNKAEASYLGVERMEDVIGKTDFDLYPEQTAEISRQEDLQVLQSKKPILSKRSITIKHDGSKTHFLTSKIPWLDAHGSSKGIIGISIDMTVMVQKEEQLNDLINVTSLQNKKLINFAHIVSHNLRSHTANFSMLLDFLVNEKQEVEKSKILKMLTKASDNLMDTLENLNEVVDISTNMNLEKKSIVLWEQINIVKENISAFMTKHHATVINNVPKKLEVLAVPAYLESVILNLLTNAVKYKHPQRSPEIILSAKQEDDYVILSISDNGLGIDLKKYGDKLFGMYKTFHNNKDARGIGLYLVKNQLQSMGGGIEVFSEINKGTTFKVILGNENK